MQITFCFNVERKSVEYEAFIQFHNELNKVLRDKSYVPHFVPTTIISLNDVHRMSTVSDNERAVCILKNISHPLECGDNQKFYRMLEVIHDHGNSHAQELVEDIKALIGSKGHDIKSTETAATPTEGIVISNRNCFKEFILITLANKFSCPHTYKPMYIHCSMCFYS